MWELLLALDLVQRHMKRPFEPDSLVRPIQRVRSERIRWIGNFQTVILDWYLKANRVPEGVRSYSQVVLLAAGTEPYWDRFR